MYYGAGTYEAFARPKKPKDADKKSAYIIGSGLAGLASAFYLLRDAQLKPQNIHVLEKLTLPGGSCDGIKDSTKGFFMRGGREMDNHFETMWDLYRDIPSLENPNVSVLDEYYWLNKEDPNYSLCRATINRGENAHTDGKFTLDRQAQAQLLKLYLTQEKLLEDKTIEEMFDSHFWESNFWLYWQTMFAFQRWSSALEMKRYLQRFVHHIDGLPDFSALRFTKYNQYESMILPLVTYLKDKGVSFEYGVDVKNVLFDINADKKIAKSLEIERNGKKDSIALSTDDLVFITNGCCTDVSCYGDQNTAPDLSKLENGRGDSWDLWRNIAKQDPKNFGNPLKFAGNIKQTNWMSATIATANKEILGLIEAICERDPLSGKVTTGGIVTIKDSTKNWYISWTINRQPQFKAQDKDLVLIWFYGLTTDKEGNYVKKAMQDCTGEEIAQEWLYHIGTPLDKIADFAKNHCNTTTCYMPYITAFFQPRKNEDRPLVVPQGSVNFAFIGQFAETPRDCIFTTEYSIRTGMEAVYTLMNVDRAVPEVWGSAFDIRELLKATYYALDKKSLHELDLSIGEKFLLDLVLKKFEKTDIELWLKDSKLV